MPRDPRFIPPHSLQHVVDTTFQNRLLLRPSKTLNRRFLGVLGRAQKEHDMVICAVVVLSTHMHLLLQPRDGQHLAEFMCFLKTNLAKEIGTRLHGWKGHFFAGRFHTTTVSNEEIDQVGVLRYLLAHGPKEFLVDTVREWPGVHSAEALVTGEPMIGRWYDRTSEYEAQVRQGHADPEDHASDEVVALSPLPCWQHLPATLWRSAAEDLIDSIDRDAAAQRAARGKPSLGARKILSADPLEMGGTSKSSDREAKGKSPQTRFHASNQEVLKEMLEIWQQILTTYRQASEQLRSGDRTAKFPEGTFPPSLPFVPFSDWTQASRGHPA